MSSLETPLHGVHYEDLTISELKDHVLMLRQHLRAMEKLSLSFDGTEGRHARICTEVTRITNRILRYEKVIKRMEKLDTRTVGEQTIKMLKAGQEI